LRQEGGGSWRSENWRSPRKQLATRCIVQQSTLRIATRAASSANPANTASYKHIGRKALKIGLSSRCNLHRHHIAEFSAALLGE
jgi:hypothetical protein